MVSVSIATEHQQNDACAILSETHGAEIWAELTPPARPRSDADSPAEFLIVEENGRICGAACLRIQSDGTAFVWAPVCESDEHGNALFADIRSRLDAAEAWIGQSLVDPDAAEVRATLERNEFPLLATIDLMDCRVGRPVSEPTVPGRLIRFSDMQDDQRLAELLEATWVDSLDCRAIHGTRSGLEAVRSHRACGDYDPALWSVLQEGDEDVAAVLTTDHADESCREVVYLGVVPAVRGRQIGRCLMRKVLSEAHRAGFQTVRLGVDENNTIAIRLYESLGFGRYGRLALHGRIHPDRANRRLQTG